MITTMDKWGWRRCLLALLLMGGLGLAQASEDLALIDSAYPAPTRKQPLAMV